MFDPSKTKAVLWDLDDTLYSRRDAARRTFPGMFKAHLYPARSDGFLEEAADYMMTKLPRNSMIHEDAFQALIAKYPPDLPYVRARCVDYYYAHMHTFIRPFPEQMEILKKLRAMGIKTGIITNIPPDLLESQRRKLRILELEPLFDVIVLTGELGIHKPDRRVFDHAAEALGVSNDQCVFVGDDPTSDVAGALNADMEAVWLDQQEADGRFESEPKVHRVRSVLEYFKL